MTATQTIPHVVRWAIIGTGWISSEFVKDLGLNPSGRQVTDVSHAVVAVGSRTMDKAIQFIKEFCPSGACAQQAGFYKVGAEAVGSYEEVYSREDVDCIYIGTPHNDHYASAKAALLAKKHVLCEKPVTITAAQVKELTTIAKANGLFFMEALWTRFFPLVYALQKDIHEDKVIGDIRQVSADFGLDAVGHFPLTHRLLNPELAGGAILDLGPYPLTWALLTLFHHPDNALERPSAVTCSMQLHPETGVDMYTTAVLDFPKLMARANLTCNLVVQTPSDCSVRVQGSKGELIIKDMSARPESYTIRPREGEEITKKYPLEGFGLYWEADAVARCLRDGLTECKRMPHAESIMAMELMDEFRKQGGYVLAKGLAE